MTKRIADVDGIIWHLTVSKWDGNDYVITIRPPDEKPWNDVPIGGLWSKENAELVCLWLSRGGLKDVMKIGANVERDNGVILHDD